MRLQKGATLLPRSLINANGAAFVDDLGPMAGLLDSLSNDSRKAYRDQNATDVAEHAATHILVVAGPGSGKSFLFLARIKHWLAQHPDANIYIATFVRKLVKDLQTDVATKAGLNRADRSRVTVSTLHALARSLLERNNGTAKHRLRAHIKVIAWPWEDVVWKDVLQFRTDLRAADHTLPQLQRQIYTEELDTSAAWIDLRDTYYRLGRFYNAVGFADMILFAREAIEENPALNSHLLWIVDEYQDFNRGEDHLVRAITQTARGVLIAGDDEQALYQELKGSHPDIIISYYTGGAFASAMLPYCSRCSYYVCLAASAFIAKARPAGAIAKIYLPLTVDSTDPKVQVVATAAPTAAVDYIAKFLEGHKSELDQYMAKLESGAETDPFLLILSPDRSASFYRTNNADKALRQLIERWASVVPGHSFDYRRVATYFVASCDALDNFALRKVLDFEGVPVVDAHDLLTAALDSGRALSQVDSEMITSAVGQCDAVAAVIRAEELSPSQQVAEIAQLITVDNPDRLVQEFEADPVSQHAEVVEDEVEAIPTAGAVSPIELMTMVGSKGLSAQHVIVIGCDNVNMARTSRLTFFVAVTRARKSLHLIASMKAGGGTTGHDFLSNLPEDYCEFVAYTKGTRTAEPLVGRAGFNEKLAQLGRAGRRHGR